MHYENFKMFEQTRERDTFEYVYGKLEPIFGSSLSFVGCDSHNKYNEVPVTLFALTSRSSGHKSPAAHMDFKTKECQLPML